MALDTFVTYKSNTLNGTKSSTIFSLPSFQRKQQQQQQQKKGPAYTEHYKWDLRKN
jgi:hypothetical protein